MMNLMQKDIGINPFVLELSAQCDMHQTVG